MTMNHDQVCPRTNFWCEEWPTACSTCPANQVPDLLDIALQALNEVVAESSTEPPSNLPPLTFFLTTFRDSPDEMQFSSPDTVEQDFTLRIADAIKSLFALYPDEVATNLGCNACQYHNFLPDSHPTIANGGITFLGRANGENGKITNMHPSLTLKCSGRSRAWERSKVTPCMDPKTKLSLG